MAPRCRPPYEEQNARISILVNGIAERPEVILRRRLQRKSVGQALLEQSEIDPASGQFINRNYSGYLVPTNADIPKLDVSFVGGFDQEASPLGTKGLGELTAVSVAPAIANAVYHATGKRVRDLPITMEKLLETDQSRCTRTNRQSQAL
jgi:hypothetical protein